jgi:hypothetical protein
MTTESETRTVVENDYVESVEITNDPELGLVFEVSLLSRSCLLPGEEPE